MRHLNGARREATSRPIRPNPMMPTVMSQGPHPFERAGEAPAPFAGTLRPFDEIPRVASSRRASVWSATSSVQ